MTNVEVACPQTPASCTTENNSRSDRRTGLLGDDRGVRAPVGVVRRMRSLGKVKEGHHPVGDMRQPLAATRRCSPASQRRRAITITPEPVSASSPSASALRPVVVGCSPQRSAWLRHLRLPCVDTWHLSICNTSASSRSLVLFHRIEPALARFTFYTK